MKVNELLHWLMRSRCDCPACLTWAFVQNDFSVQYVAMHSNTATPMIYRITGVWGSHEGSLLLWALTLSLWTVAVTIFNVKEPGF